MPKQKVPDPLSLACERVGQFLYYFSRVEMQLDDAITQVLKLDPEIAPIVTWNLDFSRKVNIVQCAVTSHNENSPSKKIEMDTFSEVFKVNTDRQTIAHCSFEPEGADAVQFRRATAHKKYKRVDPRWTKQQFEQRYEKLKRLEAKLRNIVSEIEEEPFQPEAFLKTLPWLSSVPDQNFPGVLEVLAHPEVLQRHKK